ncbi:MAG: HEAT repeat domain-containing protein [Sphingomonadaceae bacterium]|nr:HEAT repeat domain-containing protein [Sphingomonadaceae bacterium]
MGERKVILDHEVLPEDFREGAARMGWELVKEHPAGRDSTYEQIYRAGREGTSTVHYIEDQFVKVRYVFIRGPEADELAEQVMDIFDHAPDASLLAAAEKDREDLQTMVNWMLSATVLGDQAGHERLVALIEKRLAHEDPGVRRIALLAASWLEWPDFRATIERMAEADPDEDVRADAAKLAGAYRQRDEGKL